MRTLEQIHKRLDDLAALPAFEDEAPMSALAVDAAREVVDALYQGVRVFGTQSGGIRLQWQNDGLLVQAEIKPNGRAGIFKTTRVATRITNHPVPSSAEKSEK